MQQAGEDLLDQVLFHELVVHTSMTDIELKQLLDVLTSVNAMVSGNFSGTDASIVTHLSLCFLEISLADSIVNMRELVSTEDFPDIGMSDDDYLKMDKNIRMDQMWLLLAMTNRMYGIDASFALDVHATLVEKVSNYFALVRGNLVHRCFAIQFEYSSALTYCWLVSKGVLKSERKSRSTNAEFSDFSPEFVIRLNLLSMFDAFKNTSLPGFSSVDSLHKSLSRFYDNRAKFEYTKMETTRLTELKSRLEAAEWNSSFIVGLSIEQLTSSDQSASQRFFTNLYPYSHRYRMHSGTLASWPNLIAAAIAWAIQDNNRNPCPRLASHFQDFYSVPANVRMHFYNHEDNVDRLSDYISTKIGDKFFRELSAQTLNDVRRKTLKLIIRKVRVYSNMVRNTNRVLSIDAHYIGVFVATASAINTPSGE
jgi:hypothetical protein